MSNEAERFAKLAVKFSRKERASKRISVKEKYNKLFWININRALEAAGYTPIKNLEL